MGEFLKDHLPDPVTYFEAEGLKLTGRGKWRTTACNFHSGSDSMRINTATGAWVCMACNAKGGDVLAYHRAEHGLDFISAAKALGAWSDNGKPEKPQRPKPLSPRDALEVLALEAMLIAIAGGNVCHGHVLTKKDLSRVLLACGRIQHIAGAYK